MKTVDKLLVIIGAIVIVASIVLLANKTEKHEDCTGYVVHGDIEFVEYVYGRK